PAQGRAGQERGDLRRRHGRHDRRGRRVHPHGDGRHDGLPPGRPTRLTRVVTVEELEAAGLYDPSTPDAVEQLNYFRLIEARGGTIEQMVASAEAGRLGRLGSELLFLPTGERYTVDEAAAKAGVDPERIRRLWRIAGFPDLDPDDPRLTP